MEKEVFNKDCKLDFNNNLDKVKNELKSKIGDPIYFYTVDDEFGCFSNFYKCKFNDHKLEKEFLCSEQYFMYYKCLKFDSTNTELLNAIINSDNPMEIKKLGRKVKNYNEEIWDAIRFEIMCNAIYLKFDQNKTLKKILLDTEERIIYEATKSDKIWAIGYNKKDAIKVDPSLYGMNLLGKALMKVREDLRNKEKNENK